MLEVNCQIFSTWFELHENLQIHQKIFEGNLIATYVVWECLMVEIQAIVIGMMYHKSMIQGKVFEHNWGALIITKLPKLRPRTEYIKVNTGTLSRASNNGRSYRYIVHERSDHRSTNKTSIEGWFWEIYEGHYRSRNQKHRDKLEREWEITIDLLIANTCSWMDWKPEVVTCEMVGRQPSTRLHLPNE